MNLRIPCIMSIRHPLIKMGRVEDYCSMPFAAAVKLIPVPDEPFHTYLFFWRAQEHHIVLSEGGIFSSFILCLFDEEFVS